MRKNSWACFLLILAGIVIGGFIGNIFPVSWLNYGQTFGLSNPIVFDIGVICITFGLSIKITVASIIGIIVGILIYRFI